MFLSDLEIILLYLRLCFIICGNREVYISFSISRIQSKIKRRKLPQVFILCTFKSRLNQDPTGHLMNCSRMTNRQLQGIHPTSWFMGPSSHKNCRKTTCNPVSAPWRMYWGTVDGANKGEGQVFSLRINLRLHALKNFQVLCIWCFSYYLKRMWIISHEIEHAVPC